MSEDLVLRKYLTDVTATEARAKECRVVADRLRRAANRRGPEDDALVRLDLLDDGLVRDALRDVAVWLHERSREHLASAADRRAALGRAVEPATVALEPEVIP